ncbi:branched-chain amino acid ABC transporter permease [Bordetella hinzii]|uniref:Branched-chain amino acid ABC transporter, permease protein n=1 Tax=Bordetella hinzii OH87 BAL007II TaxID=1331262 RepID=A0ABR4R189_9BORD|nr:branched-chain amino acid ABC transporter permease [Bordetella hinzii]AKQ56994.1 High-affinity branched-chain amino acid transport system permease protein LivH [Bordetella hinzii]KCB23732.1 branched-chain amino acid ABC transporter, permease protein [Bordetella hinzii OH87 BAL007II]KCB27485.1 branched-chain amino acid ABC transporter, permease protein [Bordetella hinzii L60]KCB43126.1 branched-chain amino acid ABC transporter, permease protein [Bordetella hinzii 5132]QDJ42189.1 branched-cha
MNLTELLACFGSASCLVTQASTGLIVGALLFLVAAGLTLIFGVLGVINFAHGSFYMLGAYLGLTVFRLTGSYLAAAVCAGLGVALFALVFERFFMRRVYSADVLMQLLVCYAFILILDDLVKLVWGAEFQSMGMPEAFQAPPLILGGGIVPVFYLVLMAAAGLMALALWYLLARTRVGKMVRAAAQNPVMTSVLGLNTSLIYAGVFALGGFLAGLAGALAAPVRSMSPGMGFSILIESFIVTVIGGMGSVAGALVGALMLGLVRSFGSIGFPDFVEGVMFMAMALILVLKPSGLLGKEKRA